MKFLVDAQLPSRLAQRLVAAGHDAIHTLELPEGNRSSGAVAGTGRIAAEEVKARRSSATRSEMSASWAKAINQRPVPGTSRRTA